MSLHYKRAVSVQEDSNAEWADSKEKAMEESGRATRSGKSLQPVDRAEITILVDNFIDSILESAPGVSRLKDRNIDEPLLAEHGLSLLLELTVQEEKSAFLLDTGSTELGMVSMPETLSMRFGRRVPESSRG